MPIDKPYGHENFYGDKADPLEQAKDAVSRVPETEEIIDMLEKANKQLLHLAKKHVPITSKDADDTVVLGLQIDLMLSSCGREI